jgi:hypothetical protein
MSAVLGVNATLYAAGGTQKIVQGITDGGIRSFTDTYEASALATCSQIKMGPVLTAGIRIKGFKLAYDAISTVTLQVSDTIAVVGTPRYCADTATANAAGNSDAMLVDGLDYVIGTTAGDEQLVINTTGVSAATGTIKLVVFYSNN